MTAETKSPVNNKKLFLRKRFIAFSIFSMALMTGIICGILLHKYKIFPYNKIRSAYQHIPKEKAYGPWSIGIYEGNSPFKLTPYLGIKNPVLTGKNCGNELYVADPFMIKKDAKYFMFFEVMDRNNNEGNIAYAESSDLKNWKYKKVILDEKFHLSYPNVFKWKGEYYLPSLDR
jgi:hypothetical protein